MDMYQKVYYEIRSRAIDQLLDSVVKTMWPVSGQFSDIDEKIDELHDWLMEERRECSIQLGYKVE